MDRQIKLRGFRIDPGQIESVRESFDIVGRVIVGPAHVALHPPNGEATRLIGWYSATDIQMPPEMSNVQSKLAAALPPHIQPELIAVDDWQLCHA